MKPAKSKQHKNLYCWAQVMVASSQIFLGIFAGTFNLRTLDGMKVFVILFNGGLTLACWFAGWRFANYGRS